MDFATRTIHAAQPSEPETGAVIAPIFQTTTYEQIGPGEHRGFDYTRTSNPTRQRLEAVLAELEGGGRCAVFGSGLAAEHALLSAHLKPGQRNHRARRRVRRHVPHAAPRLRADRLSRHAGGFRGSGGARARGVVEHAAGLARVADQSAPARVRHRGGQPNRAREGRARRRRQHVRDAVFPAAVFARRGSHRPQRHEISRRALGCNPGRGASRAIRRSSSQSDSCRTRSAACRVRSTAG